MSLPTETAVEPVRLPARIAGLERRILERQLSLRRDAVLFVDTLRDRITSPPALLAAASLGFLLGLLSARTASGARWRSAAGAGIRGLISGVLRVVALFGGLVPALRLIPARLPASQDAAD
jgi:hypothetical protein